MRLRQISSRNLLTWLLALLVIKVTVSIILTYHQYLPPDFTTGFLLGRRDTFYGTYQGAFYLHIVSGPLALLLGLLLVSERFRRMWPATHRWLGRGQVLNVVLLVAPSGLRMAWNTPGSGIAAAGFAILAILTAICPLRGWQLARGRQLVAHRVWMWRSFLLLSSAVVLRLTAGLMTVLSIHGNWTYPLAAWTSWVLPLLVYETGRMLQARHRRSSRVDRPREPAAKTSAD